MQQFCNCRRLPQTKTNQKMKKNLFLCLSVFSTLFTQAQVIAEIKGITFYEHHSSDMTGESFGSSANGSKSGYDFVKRAYVNSFNPATMGAWQNGEEQDIDMVEHEGPFGSGGASMYLGFTSGVSSIWGGPIKGNGTTKWHKVAGGVNVYDSLKNYTDLKARYNPATAIEAIDEVKANEVYIGKIRNTDLYVMIRCTSVKIPTSPNGTQNSAILFDYKFGSQSGVTGIKETAPVSVQLYPNPTQGYLFIQSEKSLVDATFTITDIAGRFVQVPADYIIRNPSGIELNTSFLASGLYTIVLHDNQSAYLYSGQFIKNN
jgi:hypothetical protein